MEEVFVFPAAVARALLQHARKAASSRGRIPEGWSKSSDALMKLLAVFDSLRLKKGLILRAHKLGDNAFVFAIPEGTPFLEPERRKTNMDRFRDTLVLPGAHKDFMEAIEGDGSPWSYLSASFLARELKEFGACWHGCSWSTHAIVDRKATSDQLDYYFQHTYKKAPDLPVIERDEWNWKSPKPKDWDPMVKMSGTSATVTFYTISGLGTNAIYKHVDSYGVGRYTFSTQEKAIARGRGGFIF